MKVHELNTTQLANARLVNDAVKAEWARNGHLTVNKYFMAGILATCAEETGLTIREEQSYSTTKAARIRQLWKALFISKTDAFIDQLKKDDRAFFNFVYNGVNGNRHGSDDGYIFRGRGFNQITGRGNYERLGLAENPDSLNNAAIAATALAKFYWIACSTGQAAGKFKQYTGVTRTSEITTMEQGAIAGFACSAGWAQHPKFYTSGRFPVVQKCIESYWTWITQNNL